MQPPTVPPVPVYAGDTCQFPSYTFTTNGVAMNFVTAGWITWAAAWRPTIGALSPMVLTVDSSQAATGIITLSATAAQTRIMGVPGVWDVQATNSNGTVQTMIAGITSFAPDVTP